MIIKQPEKKDSEMSDTNLKKLFKDTQDFQNIFEIEVPPEMDERIKTGVDFIDEIFGEGLVPGTVTLFTGAAGGGKTTLCLQMINALSKQNIVCCLNSSEEHVSQIKKTVDRLGLEHPFFVSNSNNIDSVLRQAKENKVKVLIIDSIQTIGSGKFEAGGYKTTKDVVRKVIQFTKQNFIISILIGHVNKGGKFSGSNSLKHMTDAHLHLGLCTNPNCLTCDVGTRIINLEKFRFGSANQPQNLFLFPNGFKRI